MSEVAIPILIIYLSNHKHWLDLVITLTCIAGDLQTLHKFCFKLWIKPGCCRTVDTTKFQIQCYINCLTQLNAVSNRNKKYWYQGKVNKWQLGYLSHIDGDDNILSCVEQLIAELVRMTYFFKAYSLLVISGNYQKCKKGNKDTSLVDEH